MSDGTRIFLSILCMAAAVWMAYLGGRRIRAYFIFEKRPKMTKKVGAILQDAEQKNNVRVGFPRSIFVKYLTKAVYAYTVNGVVYYIGATRYLTTKRQTPKFVPVVYIESHPACAYIDELGVSTAFDYVLYGVLFVFISLLLVFISLAGFGIIK